MSTASSCSGRCRPIPAGRRKEKSIFGLVGFLIDWDQKQATCPNGKTSRNWRETYSRQGLPIVQATFRGADCTPCPDRARCTRSPVNARNITFRPRRQYQAQRQVRAEQSTPDWRRRYGHRAGVESLMAQASHRSDIHQARYRGLAKTFLQHTLTAMAINLLRIDAWLNGSTTTGCWTSRLTRLSQAMSPA